MQRTLMMTIVLVFGFSASATAAQPVGCLKGLESTQAWQMTDLTVPSGASIKTSIAIVEVALDELDLMPVLWFEAVHPKSNIAELDLLESEPDRHQLRFIRALPALGIAVGRMVPGACPADLYEMVKSAKTALVLGGPQFVTSDGGAAEARRQLFGGPATGARPDPQQSPPGSGEQDSRIRLETSELANGTVKVRIDALIKRGAAQDFQMRLQAATRIEDTGVLVLAKRVSPLRVLYRTQEGVAFYAEGAVLLFVHVKL